MEKKTGVIRTGKSEIALIGAGTSTLSSLTMEFEEPYSENVKGWSDEVFSETDESWMKAQEQDPCAISYGPVKKRGKGKVKKWG